MFSTRVTAIAFLVPAMLVANVSQSQQPQSPSQRFEPVRNVPPSVHVPARGPIRQLREAKPESSSHTPQTYNFSDTDREFLRDSGRSRGNVSSVQQVAYQQPTDPQVPAILQKSSTAKSPIESFDSQPMTLESLRPPTSPTGDTAPLAGGIPRENPNGGSFDRLGHSSAAAQAHQIVVDQTQFAGVEQAQGNNELRQVGFQEGGSATNRLIPAEGSPGTDSAAVHSAAAIAATDGGEEAMRQVSAKTQAGNPVEVAAIALSAPGITVQCHGPEAIGIHKLSTFKVTVSTKAI